MTNMEASAVRLHNDSHSERAEDAITQEAEHWTAGQMLEIILSEWADDEELIDIAQTLQTRRFECGMFAEEKTEMGTRSHIAYPDKDSYIEY
jgi:hypothetical protein